MTEIYEGILWQFKVLLSNRFQQIEATCIYSDKTYHVPQFKPEDIRDRLESGQPPDEVAHSLNWD